MYWTCAKGNGNSVEEVEQGNTWTGMKDKFIDAMGNKCQIVRTLHYGDMWETWREGRQRF